MIEGVGTESVADEELVVAGEEGRFCLVRVLR